MLQCFSRRYVEFLNTGYGYLCFFCVRFLSPDDVVYCVIWKDDTPHLLGTGQAVFRFELEYKLYQSVLVTAAFDKSLSARLKPSNCLWRLLPVCHLTPRPATLCGLTRCFLLVLSKFLSSHLDSWLRTSLMCYFVSRESPSSLGLTHAVFLYL